MDIVFNGLSSEWKCGAHLVTSCTPGEVVFSDNLGGTGCDNACHCTLCELLPPFPLGVNTTKLLGIGPGCTFTYLDPATGSGDEYVKVNTNDSAGHLWPKIQVSGCLTKSLSGAGGNHSITIGLDKNCLALKLTDLTDFPAVPSCPTETINMGDNPEGTVSCGECSSVCQPARLSTCDGVNFSRDCSECSDAWLRRPRIKMGLQSSVTKTQATSIEKSYYVATANYSYLDNMGWERINANFTPMLKRHKISNVGGVIKIDAPGDYEVGYSCNFEVNKGVHAVRMGIVHVPADVGKDITELVQTRFSGLSDGFYGGQNAGSVGNSTPVLPNNTATSLGGGTGVQSSIGRLIERYPAAGSTIAFFEPNDVIVFFVKISTFMGADADAASVSGQVSLRGFSDESVLGNDVAKFYAYNIDDVCDRRYRNHKYSIG